MSKHPLLWFLAAFTGVTVLVGWALYQDSRSLYGESKDLPEILHLVDMAYVDEVDMAELTPGMFQGALDQVDENASYIPPDEALRDNLAETAFDRTGLTVIKRDGYGFALAVAAASPAAEAGLRPGDYLRDLNGRTTRRMNLFHIRKVLAEAESIVVLAVRDLGTEEATIELTPRSFDPVKVDHRAYADGVHLVRIPQFYPGWEADLKAALSQAAASEKLLLDLRGNALGGEADVLALAGFFLEKGPVYRRVDSDRQKVTALNPVEGGFAEKPLFLLVDRSVSRAAELFAAVAQERGAVAVGVETWGLPDSYQALPLKNGGFVELAVARPELISGRLLTGAGIEPDIALEPPAESAGDDSDPLLTQALEAVRKAPLKKAA